MKQMFSTMLSALIILAAITSCKKNTQPADAPDTLTDRTRQLKTWLAAQPATAARQKNTAGTAPGLPPAALQWHKTTWYAAEGLYTVPAIIEPAGQKALCYLLIRADEAGNPLEAGYSLLLPDTKQMSSAAIGSMAITPGLLNGSNVPPGCSGALLQYNGSRIQSGSTVYNNGLPVSNTQAKLVAKTSAAGSPPPAEAAKVPCTGETVCTDWYWQTWVDGQLVDEQYLFTTCACDGGAGGGGMGDDVNPLVTQFYTYVQSVSNPATVNAPSTNEGPDPISFIFTWTITKGAFSSWRIDAQGKMDYYHKLMYNLQTNATEHVYDIVGYKTLTTYYVGTNFLVTTTWIPLSIVDQVHNNNSAAAYGTSQVTGKIKHKSNYTVNNPLGGSPVVLDYEDNAGNICSVKPR